MRAPAIEQRRDIDGLLHGADDDRMSDVYIETY
jgi:hypothetical protein